MAVYSKLLLSAGGGIVSLHQQADQERNAANILIGLGGTGVDCLRTIKTQVYSRLKPDDPDAILPTYHHIRFLGVDTDQKSRGIVGSEEEGRADALRALDDTEFFSIANSHVKRDLSNRLALRDREELDWLCYESIEAGDLTIAGAGGIRQVGRYMLMDKSAQFLSRLEREISLAKTGLVSPTVNIHIFSGLSGGTGAGTFLDVCYMVQEVAKRMGGATVFGYFFLPDVNLSRIPYESTNVRDYIPRNGYASMQELDYCMRIGQNGGAFTQTYQGNRKIEWDDAPVHLCHLVCATNSNGDFVENAYEYAMNVTAEYVMDFLTQSQGFDLSSHLSNFRTHVGVANGRKKYGMNMAYLVIGASCASLPLREVNTYVAAELFERFSAVSTNLPVKGDVERLAVTALGKSSQLGIEQLYGSIYGEMWEGVDSSYGRYPDDYKTVVDYGSKELVSHYSSQTSAKIARFETNARSMQDADNSASLIGRLRSQLADIIRDIKFGPICAHRMLSAAESHNLLNVIDGLIAENKQNMEQEKYQDNLRKTDSDNAKRDVEQRRKRSFLDNDQKRVADLEYYVMLLEQHKLALACYERLDETLRKLREQIEDVDATYYRRLARVTETLISTFRENHDALTNDQYTTTQDMFATPLMTMAELRGPMDRQLEKVNVAGMLSSLMGMLLDNSEDWIQEDENKICKLITKFFVEVAFDEVANRSITQFLKDKYNTDNDEDLTNRVYDDCISILAEKAAPLFYFNGSIWSEHDCEPMKVLSVPATSAPIQNAAERLTSGSRWKVKKSALTDRIYAMSSAAALPLSAYNNCDEFEGKYFTVSGSAGAHYYEGKPVPGMLFDDWRNLPPLTPQSLVNLDRAPVQVREIVNHGRELFEAAWSEQIFKGDGEESYGKAIVVRRPSDEWIANLQSAIDRCDEMTETMSTPDQTGEADALLEELLAAKELKFEETDIVMRLDGVKETNEQRRRIHMDYFVAAPPIQIQVEKAVETIRSLRSAADEAYKRLDQKKYEVSVGGMDLTNYCDALFTGVIEVRGRMVVYHRTDNAIGEDPEIVLSKRGPEFPFGAIPAYQGYVSFKGLDPAIKELIHKEADDRYNEDSSEIEKTGTKLKGEFTDERFRAWGQLAANHAERADIIEFLNEMRKKFETFCMENAI